MWANYTNLSSLDSDIGRLSLHSDDTVTLQSYSYLGLNTDVVMAEPQSDIELTYLTVDSGTSSSDDGYTSLDQFGRVDEQLWYNTSTSTAVYDVQYIRDDDGNVRFSIDTLHSSMGGLYEYDSLGQVTEYEQGDVVYLGPDYGISGSVVESETFTYDSLGNDLVNSTTTTGTVTIDSGFNYDNQITSISSGTLPTYDNNGNMLTDQNDLVYVVNAWNEIVTVKNSSGTTLETYTYDGLGDRMTNTVYTDDVGTTTNFFNSTEGQVIEEQANATGYYTQRYVWSPTYINSMVDRDTDTSGSGLTPTGSEFSRVWPIQDANYNTVALVVMSDGSATVVERYAYLPFGTVTYMNGSYTVESGSSCNWLNLFQGERQDSTTGNYMSLTRWDNPGTGTWMNEDPIGFDGGNVDLYGYESDNPINQADPSGLMIGAITCSSICGMTLPALPGDAPKQSNPPKPSDPNFVGPPAPPSLKDQILVQSTHIVDDIGQLPVAIIGIGGPKVEVPGREGKPELQGNGPCYYFAQRFCKWLQEQISYNPDFKGVKVWTHVINRKPGSGARSHIIVRVVIPQGNGKDPLVLLFDAGTGDLVGAGNMGGPDGQIDTTKKENRDNIPSPLPQGKPVPILPPKNPTPTLPQKNE